MYVYIYIYIYICMFLLGRTKKHRYVNVFLHSNHWYFVTVSPYMQKKNSPNHVFSLYNPSQNFNLLRSSISPYPSLAQWKRRQNQNYSRERGREPPNLSNDDGYVLFLDFNRGTYQPPDFPQCTLGSTVLLWHILASLSKRSCPHRRQLYRLHSIGPEWYLSTRDRRK